MFRHFACRDGSVVIRGGEDVLAVLARVEGGDGWTTHVLEPSDDALPPLLPLEGAPKPWCCSWPDSPRIALWFVRSDGSVERDEANAATASRLPRYLALSFDAASAVPSVSPVRLGAVSSWGILLAGEGLYVHQKEKNAPLPTSCFTLPVRWQRRTPHVWFGVNVGTEGRKMNPLRLSLSLRNDRDESPSVALDEDDGGSGREREGGWRVGLDAERGEWVWVRRGRPPYAPLTRVLDEDKTVVGIGDLSRPPDIAPNPNFVSRVTSTEGSWTETLDASPWVVIRRNGSEVHLYGEASRWGRVLRAWGPDGSSMARSLTGKLGAQAIPISLTAGDHSHRDRSGPLAFATRAALILRDGTVLVASRER